MALKKLLDAAHFIVNIKTAMFQNKGFIGNERGPFSGFNGPADGGDSDFGGEDMFRNGEVQYIYLVVGVGCFHSTIGYTDWLQYAVCLSFRSI